MRRILGVLWIVLLPLLLVQSHEESCLRQAVILDAGQSWTLRYLSDSAGTPIMGRVTLVSGAGLVPLTLTFSTGAETYVVSLPPAYAEGKRVQFGIFGGEALIDRAGQVVFALNVTADAAVRLEIEGAFACSDQPAGKFTETETETIGTAHCIDGLRLLPVDAAGNETDDPGDFLLIWVFCEEPSREGASSPGDDLISDVSPPTWNSILPASGYAEILP